MKNGRKRLAAMLRMAAMRSRAIIALATVIGLMAGCDNPVNTVGGGFVAVSSITNIPTSGTVGDIPLYGTVNPPEATNQTIAWSVVSEGTTGASISRNTLTTTAAGTVTVRATIVNGLTQRTNYTQDFDITIYSDVTPFAITYTVTQDGGVDGETDSTGIIFTFNDDSVYSLDLTAADITVGGAAAKGAGATLSGEELSWLLAPITVNAAELATVSINKPGIEAGTKSVTVYKEGEYVPEYWTITWELNGGTGAYPTQIVKGETLARPSPDPAKAGNTFGGWYTNSALTQEYDFANPVTADLNLYAKWEAVSQSPINPPAGTPVSGNTLAEKLQWVKDNAVSNTTYTIEVNVAEEIDPHTLSYTGRSNITVILWGSVGEKVVSLSQNGSLFTIGTDVTLVLDRNITLQGRSNNTALVSVSSGGELVMNTGAKISGNTSSYQYGGGVHINGGTLTISGGEISGNTSSYYYGGGVYVVSGTLTMAGGEISGNTGIGGVYIASDGTFTMAGGEISGNTGTGVYFVSDGTFTMAGGEISGNTGPGVFIGSDGTFTMAGGEISGNNSHSYNGGGVYVRGTFTMTDGKISGNGDSGVYVGGGTFTMNDGEISGNVGRGVYIPSNYDHGGYGGYGGDFTMADGKISGNAGGVYVGGSERVRGTFTMSGGEISGNSITSNGGGVYVGSGTFTMSGGEISGNTSSTTGDDDYYYSYSSGGGVYVYSGTFTMEGGTISDNTSSAGNSYGGGVYVGRGTFTMNDGEISGNTTSSYTSNTFGGGVFVDQDGTFTMNDGEISGNTSSTTGDYSNSSIGGGVCVGGTFTMNDGEISGNSSFIGGGVFVGGGTFTMNDGEISGNTSSSSGGGVFVGDGTFTMKGGEISDNTVSSSNSSSSGGGVYVHSGTFTMIDGEISGNTVSSSGSYSSYRSFGGGVYIGSGTFTMEGGTISGNTSSSTTTTYTFGGGVYVGQYGTFTKTDGTINNNVVKHSSGSLVDNQGNAAYVGSNPAKRRETTAGPGVELDSKKTGTEGGWEN